MECVWKSIRFEVPEAFHRAYSHAMAIRYAVYEDSKTDADSRRFAEHFAPGTFRPIMAIDGFTWDFSAQNGREFQFQLVEAKNAKLWKRTINRVIFGPYDECREARLIASSTVQIGEQSWEYRLMPTRFIAPKQTTAYFFTYAVHVGQVALAMYTTSADQMTERMPECDAIMRSIRFPETTAQP